MDERDRAIRGALPRQPACPICDHEAHATRCDFDLGGAPCPCPPHLPPGIYDQEARRG